MTHNIAAFTHVGYKGYYPPYISINEVDGAIEVSVRSAEKDNVAGSFAKITLSKEDFFNLIAKTTGHNDV